MNSKKTKTLLLLLIPVLILGMLALRAFQDSAAYYYSISEVSALERSATGKLRIKGELVQASVAYDPRIPSLEFTLEEDGNTLPVLYKGVLPDNFQHAEQVIVEGKFDQDSTFIVSKLMLQCPSKYEGDE